MEFGGVNYGGTQNVPHGGREDGEITLNSLAVKAVFTLSPETNGATTSVSERDGQRLGSASWGDCGDQLDMLEACAREDEIGVPVKQEAEVGLNSC